MAGKGLGQSTWRSVLYVGDKWRKSSAPPICHCSTHADGSGASGRGAKCVHLPTCHYLTHSLKQCALPRTFRLPNALLECGRGASIHSRRLMRGRIKKGAHPWRLASRSACLRFSGAVWRSSTIGWLSANAVNGVSLANLLSSSSASKLAADISPSAAKFVSLSFG